MLLLIMSCCWFLIQRYRDDENRVEIVFKFGPAKDETKDSGQRDLEWNLDDDAHDPGQTHGCTCEYARACMLAPRHRQRT